MQLTSATTAVVLDSTCDLPSLATEHANVRIVPLTVRFGDEEHRDWIDLTPEQFYARLAQGGQSPRTSQPSPDAFARTYQELFAAGYEHVLGVYISGKLSGTAESARLAAADWPGKVTVLDSRSASVCIALCARRVLRMLAEGTTPEDVAAYVEAYAGRHRIVVAVDTLEYLVRGGRIGRARGLVGQMLNVKPILGITDGEVVPVGRVRGASKVLGAIERELEAQTPADGPLRVAVAGTTDAGMTERVVEAVQRVRPNAAVEAVSSLGAVIGTYTGPRAFGVGWASEEPVL